MKRTSKLNRRDVLKAGVLGSAALAGLGATIPSKASSSTNEALKGLKPLYRKVQEQTPRSLPSTQLLPESPKAISATPTAAIRALRRLGFGYHPPDLVAFEALGADFDEQLENWVDGQIAGYGPVYPPGNDTSLMNVLNEPGTNFTTLDDSLETMWAERVVAEPDWPYYMYPLIETQYLTMLRAVYSEWQLGEVMADFWHTHFSVQGNKFEVAPVFVHYDRDVIRPNVFGNFRHMLEEVTKSTAMMRYLDNNINNKYGPNENFAREVQELHTLGAENSYGFQDEGDIPAATAIPGSSAVLPAGLKAGYSEADVVQVTLCLTGWTISTNYTDGNNTGTYIYHPDWHDESSKRVLGIDIIDSGEDEFKAVMDLLAVHPETARYVCRKLCRRLISDNPPESVVEAAAQVFNDQWQAADQLAQVVRTIILSDEFKAASNWGEKTKRPFELIMGAIRSCGGFSLKLVMPTPFSDSTANLLLGENYYFSQSLYWTMESTGHMPFTWATPDGFPDNKQAWLGSTPLIMGWRVLNYLSMAWFPDDPANPDTTGWHTTHPVDVVAVTKLELSPGERTANNIVDLWVERFLGYDATTPAQPQLNTGDRDALVLFMQQDAASADTVLDLDSDGWASSDWNAYVPQRLQTLVFSMAMLPDNMLR